MEKDDEISGDGNSYTTEFRQYDPRVGRWFSRDPEAFKLDSWSPYAFAFNNPLYYTDTEGNIPFPVPLKWIKFFVWGAQLPGDAWKQEFTYRPKKKRMHWGIDFNVSPHNHQNIPILNLADGVVLESGSTPNGGNFITIKHGNGYITRYFHLKEKPTLQPGDKVKEGQELGIMGGTYGYQPHGHLEIAKIPDGNIANEKAIEQFKSYKYHINPRDIVGPGKQGNGGDLQKIANGGSNPSSSTGLMARMGQYAIMASKYDGMPLRMIGGLAQESVSMSSSVQQSVTITEVGAVSN